MTDKELYRLCKKYGAAALEARRKFAGLLPEVNKRRLYEKKGFHSIYEFGARLAGMSREQVDMVIRLERKLEDKPILHSALTEGRISPNKLIRIVSIATIQNQNILFETVRDLSKQAIDVFVKDFKNENVDNTEIKNQNGLFESESISKCLPGQTLVKNHDLEIIAAMSPELKQKIQELLDKGFDINGLFLQFLEQREREIENEKEEIACAKTHATTRYIPAQIRKNLKREYGGKCAHPTCNRQFTQIHHTKKFSIFKSHDPRYLQPLCSGHHELAHVKDRP